AWPTPPPVDANLSAVFATRWDRTNLYVAVRVTDDQRGISAASEITQTDTIEIYVNGDPNPTVAPDGPDAYQLSFAVDGRFAIFRDGNPQSTALMSQIRHAVKQGNNGDWTLEVRVPFALLGFATANAGRVVGFDININDDDNDLTRQRWLVWKDAPLSANG